MSSSAPSSQSSITSRQSTTKLRAACNSCCAAKVKCSGQKTGCERCHSIGSACIYLESRVGKVPGVRAKRKQSQSQSQPGHQATFTRHADRPNTPAPSSHESTFLASEYD